MFKNFPKHLRHSYQMFSTLYQKYFRHLKKQRELYAILLQIKIKFMLSLLFTSK